MQLTDEHRAVLDLEGQRWKFLGAKEATVRERFGRSLVEHHQLVAWLIRQPEALAYAPATVKRLQRLRDARARVRGQAS